MRIINKLTDQPVFDSNSGMLHAEYYEAGNLDLSMIQIAVPVKPADR